jgi:type II secretory pathway component GspD/PulD (secretin)
MLAAALLALPVCAAGQATDDDGLPTNWSEMSAQERREFMIRRNQSTERLERLRRQLEQRGMSASEIDEIMQRERERAQDRLDRLRRQQAGEAAQAASRQPRDDATGGDAPEGAGAAEGVRGAFGEAETIELAFAEAVSLDQLVDVISEALEINIFAAPGLENESVIIKAPIEIPKDELLKLLSVLLDDRGFVLQEGDDGLLRINRAGQMSIRVGEGPLSTTRVIPTPNLRPSGLQQMLQNVLTGGSNPSTPGGAGGQGVNITPLDELGVIVASGSATRLDNVQRLIDLLVEAAEDQRLHLLPVTNVAASFARERMIELQGQLVSAAGAAQAPQAPRPGADVRSASGSLSRLAERLYVHSGNSLLFRGTRAELSDVENLLRIVDQVSPLIAKRYQTGAVTEEVVRAAEALGLGASERIENVQNQGLRQQFGQQGRLPQTAEATGIGDSRFVVDSDNGTLIYFGTPEQHERVQELVQQFRRDMIDNGTQIRVYKLLYASADAPGGGGGGGATLGGGTDGEGRTGNVSVSVQPNERGVAEILQDLIQDPQEARVEGRFVSPTRQGGGVSAAEDAILAQQAAEFDGSPAADLLEDALGGTRLVATEENTVIVPDGARNQVIIKAPALAHRQFEAIIAQLDRRQPQVQVEVRIVSLTTNDGFDWSTAYDFNVGDFNLSGLFGAAAGTDDIVDTIQVPAPTPGLTLGLINSDYVPFAINTLETLGDTEVTSTPSVLTNDNATASFVSEQEVPFAETTVNANTQTTSQGGVSTAGTILDVTPRISGAGEVTLALNIELSDFLDAPTGNLAPPAQRDQFTSQVTLPTNSTIVIGGFRLRRRDRTEAGIPLLMDIPLLGNLFKDVSTSTSDRTIFLFITPRIIEETDNVSLRLLSEGPLKVAGYDDGMPTYEPRLIPVRDRSADLDRALERLRLDVDDDAVGPSQEEPM